MRRIVIVTGAGGGLGRALVRAVARRGHLAIAFGRDADRLQETGAGLTAGQCEPYIVNAADLDAVTHAVATIADRHGRIDGLFANAACYPRLSLLDQTPTAWMNVLQLNVGGVMAACRAALPIMMRTGHGRVITVGSFADIAPIADSSAYAASKGALHALTRAMACDIGSDYPDILINEWVPGALNTQMGVPHGIDVDLAAQWGAALLDLEPGGPTGRMFEGDHLVEPTRSLKQRVLGKIGLG